MNNNFNVNEIVKVEQMPKVFSQLEKIGAFIDEQTKDLDKLECTEENKQEVKNRRTEINNALKILEDKRIEIKNQLLEPYNIFNSKYEEECKVKLEEASELLKEKIDFIENGQRKEKEDELRVFFEQYQKDYHLEDLVKFEDVKLNITITASMKSLKDKVVDFLTTIRNDIEIINNEENSDELLLEYKNNGFDYQRAKLNLIERKKQLEALKQKQEIVKKIETEEAKVEEKAIEITAPKEIIEEDEKIEVTFTLKGSKNKILQVKKLIEELGIEYE